ncbi:MAG: Nramp family divalent metal transporter, partial [Bacteroidota bacterium]
MSDKHDAHSLSEIHSSVDTTQPGLKGFRRLVAFLGPAYLVSVGYMDPGNWATDIAGGSRYGYALIWVLLLSNLMAVLLQSLSARLGIVRGQDLAQASRQTYPRPVNFFLYLLAEIAIAATDLAEVLGMAIGLQLLFGWPLLWGVCFTALDTFLLLFLINLGMRRIEAFIICLISIIGLAFLTEMILAKPDLTEVVKGFAPGFPDETALYIAIGIIGATVMPHNLYLHSSLVQTRKIERSSSSIRRALRFNLIDSTIALNLAFFVNSAILILAASTFFSNGMFEVSEIQDAHRFLEPLLGSKWAPILFAVALIAAGQSSTITGTLAGQIVMEGYLNLRIAPWMRRLITRLVAIIPAVLVIIYFGEEATGELLVLSQVILSLQLGFAVIPLIHFVSDKARMGEFVIPKWVKLLSWASAVLIVGLNGRLVVAHFYDWMQSGAHPIWIYGVVVPAAIATGVLLLYVTFRPFWYVSSANSGNVHSAHPDELGLEVRASYSRIAIALDFSSRDQHTLSAALAQGGKTASYLLVHVLESPGAMMMAGDIEDRELKSDRERLQRHCDELVRMGYEAEFKVGFGRPQKAIAVLATDFRAQLIVMGGHGHRGF